MTDRVIEVRSGNGVLTAHLDGTIHTYALEGDEWKNNPGDRPAWFDFAEWNQYHRTHSIPGTLDILDTAYYTKDGWYVPAETSWRQDRVEEELHLRFKGVLRNCLARLSGLPLTDALTRNTNPTYRQLKAVGEELKYYTSGELHMVKCVVNAWARAVRERRLPADRKG